MLRRQVEPDLDSVVDEARRRSFAGDIGRLIARALGYVAIAGSTGNDSPRSTPTCPNLEDSDRQWAQRTIEVAEDSFAAGKKASPDEPSQKAIAAACHRAARSIGFATQRCLAGKRPKVD